MLGHLLRISRSSSSPVPWCYSTTVLLMCIGCIYCPNVVTALEINENDYPLWQFLIIPPISGFVGWLTNLVALKMTFYPVKFLGIPFIRFKDQPFGLFGWQGIIPSKAGKMASITVDLMVGKLIDVKKVFERLDPYKMAKVLEPGMKESMREVVDKTMVEEMPVVWDDVPQYIKEDFYKKILETVPGFFQSLLEDIQENIFDVFDIKDFSVRKMVLDKSLLNNIFLECGDKEFRFIELSGFFLGFGFGIFQSLVLLIYDKPWVFPGAGFVVGFATNLIALKLIFEPVEPIYICGFKLHGLFLRRQKEVSVKFAQMAGDFIYSPDQMWSEILYGPLAPKFEEYVRRHSKKTTKKLIDGMEDGVMAYLTEDGFKAVEDRIADKIIAEIPNTIHLGYKYSKGALALETEIREKLIDLPSSEFEGVLHPAFQEDEFKLILVGAILGMAVGFFQLYLIFGKPEGESFF